MGATIKDVAERAGVSTATVSKYMNGGNLRESYRVRVQAAVEELNYSINELARNLKFNRSFTIGIMASTIRSTFITVAISEMQIYFMEKGYSTLIVDYQRNRELERRQINLLLKRQVDGIILFPENDETDILETIRSHGIPVVLVDNMFTHADCDAVVTNNEDCSYAVTRRLIELGHRNIAFCAGPAHMFTARERLRGYMRAMDTYRLEPNVAYGNYVAETSCQAIKQLLLSEQRPTALICSNYYTTLGALAALKQLQRSFPEDISLVGFDQLEFDNVLPCRVSCVVQPLESIGSQAARLLLSRLDGDDSQGVQVRVVDSTISYTDSIRKI